MHEVNVPRVSIRGDKFKPTRSGSQHPDGGPTGLYRCGDGTYINMTTLPHQWPQVAAALGKPELVDDPRFKDGRGRRDNNEAIRVIFEAWLATFPTREAAIAVLEQHRVPCAPILTINEAIEHPHLRERGTVRQVSDPQLGTFAIPGMPVRLTGWTPKEDLTADLLGQHNEGVLKELAGLSDADIAALYEQQVLVQDAAVKKAAG
jgi:CoA:oxalate CoA-transferase